MGPGGGTDPDNTQVVPHGGGCNAKFEWIPGFNLALNSPAGAPLDHNPLKFLENGSRSRTRTYDRAINSRLLYQLSYSGLVRAL